MRLIEIIADGAPGHGLVHLFLHRFAESFRPTCLLDQFNTPMLLYWRDGVTVSLLTCVVRKGFRGGRHLD